MRKGVLYFADLHVAAFGNGQRARKQLRTIFENEAHLLRAFHKELIAVKLEPVRILQRLAGLHAHQHVMGARIVFAEIVAVVGRH